MCFNYVDLIWAVLGVCNLCLSVFGATAVVKSRSEKEYDLVLACVTTTGCINMLAEYLRSNTNASWFEWAFTITLMLDSILNVATAFRVMKAYQIEEVGLPRYMPVAQMEWPIEKCGRV